MARAVKEEQRLNDLQSVVTELLLKYSHSSSFVERSKHVLLDHIEIDSKTSEFYSTLPTYVAPREQFMWFSEDFYTLAKDLFGHCAFESQIIDFQTQRAGKLIRSQSLVEMPTFR